VREYLQLTVAFDHDIVDGAPAARFTKRLVEVLETGSVLEEGGKEQGAGGSEEIVNS